MKNEHITLKGIHLDTGCVFDIELKNKKGFSNPMLRDVLLLNNDRPGETANIIGKTQGATDFFGHVGREFNMTVKEIEEDITELEKRVLVRSSRK